MVETQAHDFDKKEQHSESGLVLFSGSVAHSLTGRTQAPVLNDGVPETNLWGFHILPALRHVKIAVVASGPTAAHYFAISREGVLYGWGRNERGQLGLKHSNNVYNPVIVPNLPPIAAASCARSHSVILSRDGRVFACGENSKGQCGIGRITDQPLTHFHDCKGLRSPACSVSAGLEFSLASCDDGHVYVCGSEEHGQCGTGKTGERIERANKVVFDYEEAFTQLTSMPIFAENVIQVSAGAMHGACLTKSGAVYTWGDGGYGRLGHKSNVDELIPRKVAFFDERNNNGVKKLTCGGTCTYYVTGEGEQTQLLFSGILKKTGEANMFPKPVYDLAGWSIRSIAAGVTATVVAAANTLITWGPSPTYGELGYGDLAPKSSTKPKEVDLLLNTHIIDVATSIGGTVVVLDVGSDTKEGIHARELIDQGKIPDILQQEPEPYAHIVVPRKRPGFAAHNEAKKSKEQ